MPVVNYLWNPLNDNIVREFDDEGTVVAEYTTEATQFGNVVSQRRSAHDSVYHYDGQGSTLALTNANGDVIDTYAYSAFGEVTARTGSTVNPFQYIGQKQYYRDEESGDYEVRQRPLSSLSTRWLTTDPAPPSIARSAYLYADNSPMKYSDPSGLAIAKDIVDLLKKSCECQGKDIPRSGVPSSVVALVICANDSISFIWGDAFLAVHKGDYELMNKCGLDKCTELHEKRHGEQLMEFCPADVCKGRQCTEKNYAVVTGVDKPGIPKGTCRRIQECDAYVTGLNCELAKVKDNKGNAACEKATETAILLGVIALLDLGCYPGVKDIPEIGTTLGPIYEKNRENGTLERMRKMGVPVY